MRRVLSASSPGFLLAVTLLCFSQLPAQTELTLNSENARVDVAIRGQAFTSYLFGEGRAKPVLFPLRAPGGRIVNRIYPFSEETPGEELDHPHQASVFFAFGDVEGLDFWMGREGGRIVHRSILEMKGGETGLLRVLLDWLDSEGRTILQEIRRMEFGGGEDSRWLDHTSRLLAHRRPVRINESKEGLFAIRVAAAFREDRGNSEYLDAFGRRGAKSVWGTRAPWLALQGELSGAPLTIAIFDHPTSFNHPAYWHARDYGLFSVNPLGRKDFVEGAVPVGFEIRVSESMLFRYRLSVYSADVSKQRLDGDYQAYIR